MSARLKVAIVSDYPLDPGKVEGGVRSVTQNLVRGLCEYDDLEIHVIHCHSDVAADRTSRDGEATIHYLSRSKRRIVPNMITSVGVVAKLLKQLKPDVVNAHSGPYAVASLRAGFPTIYTTHCVTRRYMWAVGGWFDHARLLLDAIFDNFAASRVKHIIAISPYVVDSYRWASQAAFYRVDNPVSEFFHSAEDRTVAGRVFYAGMIAEVKNVMMLMRALERIQDRVPQVHLHAAGWVTSPNYKRTVDRFLADKDIGKRIALLGSLDMQGMLKEYEEASLLALPSKEETQPIVIIEAMVAGKPVVATDVGGVADLIDDGITGFVVPSGAEQEMAERVAQILLDPELGRKMGQRGREAARSRFSIRRAAQGYREVFLAVAGRRELVVEGHERTSRIV